jgi:hypothetical protein
MMNAVSYKPGQFVWKLGDNAFFSFLVATGQVHVQGPRFKQVATTTVGEEAKVDEAKGTDTDTATKRDSKGSIKEQGELLIDESYWLGTKLFSCSLQAKTAVTGYVVAKMVAIDWLPHCMKLTLTLINHILTHIYSRTRTRTYT